MSKTDVYSWRVDPGLKARLERQAREAGISLATLLDLITSRWLEERTPEDDEADQARRHAAARGALGSIAGRDPLRSERSREAVRKRLRRRHAS